MLEKSKCWIPGNKFHRQEKYILMTNRLKQNVFNEFVKVESFIKNHHRKI